MDDLFTEAEERDIQELIQEMKTFLQATYPEGTVLRNFHPKMHGLLKGTLQVLPDIPPELRQGMFKQPKSYEVWVRLSNAPPKVQSDKPASGRGLAIKVLDVEGEMLETDPIGVPSQNFLLTTSPILSAWNIRLYKKAIRAVLFGFWAQLTFALNPWHWRSIFLTLTYSAKHDNLLSQTYFSGGAFRFGPDRFVKFVLHPQDASLGYTLDKPKSDSFLKEQLVQDMEKSARSFTLSVQLHENESKHPLENTSKVWKAATVPLATLTLPIQKFDLPERIALAEEMEFSPWIGLVDHVPVGGINRARRRVYKELAAFRKTQ